MSYNMVISSEGRSSIALFTDEGAKTIPDSHPNFAKIVTALVNNEDITDLLSGEVRRVVEVLSDRVEIIDGVLHFDGDAIYDALSDTIARYHAEGRDTANIVRFMERLADNPNPHSREQLFTWSMAADLTINKDGFIVAYKGVDENLCSLTAGKADVNGVEITGIIPYALGSVVTMPRSEVEFNPSRGCSTGLHVGNWSYASSFGPVTLEVLVDPADVVSVPTDCSWQKMRVCRVLPVARHDKPEDDLSDHEPEAAWEQEDVLDSDIFAEVPTGILARFRDRLSRRNRKERLS